MSQKEQILDFVKRHGSITPQDAMDYIVPKCYRLGARVPEINERLLGWTDHHIINENPMGKYARYRFETDEERETRLNE